MDEDPNNDVTPPCTECGDADIACACTKPIETLVQLERAVRVTGAALEIRQTPDSGWCAVLRAARRPCKGKTVVAYDISLSLAVGTALTKWYEGV